MPRSADQLISDCLRGGVPWDLLEEMIEETEVDWQSLKCDLLKDFDAIPAKPERVDIGETTRILFNDTVYEENKPAILFIVETYAGVYHDIDFVIGRTEDNGELG